MIDEGKMNFLLDITLKATLLITYYIIGGTFLNPIVQHFVAPLIN
jgi:hypothetical protein